MHQTRRFKRINGTAYPDSIASILRDASGAKLSRLAESSDAAEPMFAYEDREVPGEEEGRGGSEGARLKGADVGVGRFYAGPDRWSEQHRGGRGGGPQGRGPSAALGRLASEEPACVSNQPLDEEALERKGGQAPFSVFSKCFKKRWKPCIRRSDR